MRGASRWRASRPTLPGATHAALVWVSSRSLLMMTLAVFRSASLRLRWFRRPGTGRYGEGLVPLPSLLHLAADVPPIRGRAAPDRLLTYAMRRALPERTARA